MYHYFLTCFNIIRIVKVSVGEPSRKPEAEPFSREPEPLNQFRESQRRYKNGSYEPEAGARAF